MESSFKRVHESLQQVFQRHRLVFWYDPEQQWQEAFESFDDETVNKVTIANNEFGTKVAIHRDPDPLACYLLYVSAERPADADNWLLDLLLQGHEFKADRASLALQELGLPYDFLPVVEEHLEFFKGSKRVEMFKKLLHDDDDAVSLRLKMMAVLLKSEADIDALLLSVLGQAEPEAEEDPVQEHLSASNLVDTFWAQIGLAFGYTASEPTLKDFATTLFRWDSPLDRDTTLHPHTRVFLQRWKDSQTHGATFRTWARHLEATLHVEEALNGLDRIEPVIEADTYPLIEKFVLHQLCQQFMQKETSSHSMQETIHSRRSSFWFTDHEPGYEALEQAIVFRDLMETAELSIESIDSGIQRYMTSWHRIDTAYRRFHYYLRQYRQVALMESIANWVEGTYVNNFLLPLSDRWSDQVRRMTNWRCEQLPAQTSFFDHYVQPFLDKKQKPVVVISDALRYAAAAELVGRLRADNRWKADLEALFASLPSYTQLGMASLLPGRERSLNPEDGTVTLDDRPTTGLANRSQILGASLEGRGVAIKAEAFLEMHVKDEVRPLFKDNDVVFIYHDVIDKTAHHQGNEAKTAKSVEEAFEELQAIFRKIAGANRDNMLLTADHGFLFQQSDLHQQDDQPLPTAEKWLKIDRRYAIGRGIAEDPAVKTFTAQQLRLNGDWESAFPLGLGRFPLRGAGKKFVHGGLSLHEVIVPVVKIHKARVDDVGQVEIDVMRLPNKITTGQLSLAFYQNRPVTDKIKPRRLRIGVFAPDGTPLSEERTVDFDSDSNEARQRESRLGLTLSRAADDYNNQEVEIRLQETVPGTQQTATYQSHRVKLQKPFAGDFDDI